MKDLAKCNIDLEKYMIQIGAKTLKYESRVMNDPDPDPLGMGEQRVLEDESNSDKDLSDDEHDSVSLAPVTLSPCTFYAGGLFIRSGTF